MRDDSALTVVVGLSVLVLTLIAGCGWTVMTEDSADIHIESKWVKRHGDSDQYMVNSDKLTVESFIVDDNWVKGVYNSTDIWASLAVGSCYSVGMTGMRVPLLSKFRSIYEAKEIPCE